MCEWVKEAWKELSVQLIKKSFLVCGVTASVDGTDDNQIECLKEGRAAAAAKPLMLTKTQALQKEGIEDDEDPFADLDSVMMRTHLPTKRMSILLVLVMETMALKCLKRAVMMNIL